MRLTEHCSKISRTQKGKEDYLKVDYSNLRVLVVEDNEINSLIIENHLKHFKFKVDKNAKIGDTVSIFFFISTSTSLSATARSLSLRSAFLRTY